MRIGLTPGNAADIARFLGTVGPKELADAALAVTNSQALTDEQRAALGRFELAADARISSALSRAQDVYLGTVRCAASVLSIVLAEAAALMLGTNSGMWMVGLLVGIVAVPLAPIANDVVGALQAATKALRGI